jgi:hypothetical protein
MTTDEEIIKAWNKIYPKQMDDDKAAIRLWRMAEKDTERKLLLKFAKSSPSGATSAPENAKKKGDKR